MSEPKTINLSKQSLPQLQELLERQNILMRNKKLLEHLKDKGASVVQLHDKIEKEIQHRKDLENLQTSFSGLTTNEHNPDFLKEKHTEYVCSKENTAEDTRYRPHRTLMHKETKKSPEKSPKKFVEITAAFEPKSIHESTKLIPLSESLVIQHEQALKVMEEQAKKALSGLRLSGLMENDDEDEQEQEQNLQNETANDDS